MARAGGIEVRDFQAGEEAQILAIAREAQAHELTVEARSKPVEEIGLWYVELRKQDVATYKGRFLVAELAGAIAGYAVLLFKDSSEDRVETFYTFAHVADLGVRNECRGQGVGTALLAACETIAREAGETYLQLGVLAGNHDAVRLYERQGFRAVAQTMEKVLT